MNSRTFLPVADGLAWQSGLLAPLGRVRKPIGWSLFTCRIGGALHLVEYPCSYLMLDPPPRAAVKGVNR